MAMAGVNGCVVILVLMAHFCCSTWRVDGRILEDSTLGLSEVDWHLEHEHVYLGSPSIVRLTDDRLVASHDYFGAGMHFATPADYKVSVFGSSNQGVTWSFLANVSHMYWANLFLSNGSLYLMGTASDGQGTGKNISHVSIARSTDGGKTWTQPTYVFRGPYHTAPTPVLALPDVDGGRIFRAIEYWKPPGSYGIDFYATVVSASMQCTDLTDASCWKITDTLQFNKSWIPSDWGQLVDPSWQEGNAIVTPDGKGIVNILRFNGPPVVNKAAVVDVHLSSGALTFRQFISFPGGHTKFTIRRHPLSRTYWTLSNNVTNASYDGMRNVLTVAHSDDLITWHVCERRLLEDDTGFGFADSVRFTGFHYVDWQFD
eukprot:scpid84404/ scgid8603/ 